MKKFILFVLLSAGWYNYVSSSSTNLWALALLLFGSVILIRASIRAYKKILAAQNVVAAAATYQTLSEEQRTSVHDHAIDIVLRGGWRGRGDEGPSFSDDAEKFGWYALAMHEQGIKPICLVKNWNYVKNPFTDVFIVDVCIDTCIKAAQRQGHQVKLLPRTPILPAIDPLSISSDLAQLDNDDNSSTPPTHMQVQAETICRSNQIWFLAKLERNYPLSERQIALLKDRWDWQQLSTNDSLPWSEALVAGFEDCWDWSLLSCNESIQWSEALILKYSDRWDWAALSINSALPWSRELVVRLSPFWDWFWLSSNESIPWSERLLSSPRFVDRWHWDELSSNEALPWTETLIRLYKDRWHWHELSGNKSVPWSEALIIEYEDKWDWNELSHNESLPWTEALISRFEERWLWGEIVNDDLIRIGLGGNEGIPWTEAFIASYEARWNDYGGWHLLSRNTSLPWTEALICRFEDRWDWGSLSDNKSLPWAEAFIVRYEDRWKTTQSWTCLSRQTFAWTESLITRYADRWDWNWLSGNKSLPWSESFIARFEDRWDWGYLRENDSLSWHEPLITRFEHKLNEWRNKPIRELDNLPIPDVFSTKPSFVVEGYNQPLCFNLTLQQVDSILDECFKNPVESTWDWASESLARRVAEVNKAWLKVKVTLESVEEKHMVLTERLGPTPLPFGFHNEAWVRLLGSMEDGDELWEYSSESHYWENLAGRSGIALVRNGEIIDCITTRMN